MNIGKKDGTKNHLDKIHQREHNDCLVFKPKRYNPFRRKVLLEILKKVTSKTSESFENRWVTCLRFSKFNYNCTI